MGIRGGIKSELYNRSKQILMILSRGILVNGLFMSKEHILSGNTDSLRMLSTKLKEFFIQWQEKFLETGFKTEGKNLEVWYCGKVIIYKIG